MGKQPTTAKKSKKKLWTGIAIAIIIIAVIAVIIMLPQRTDLANGGTVKSVSGGEYLVVEFNASSPGTIYGSVNTSNGIIFYLMNPGQYSSFVTNGSPSGYEYTTGDISSGSFNTNMGSGTWYAIFYNPHLLFSTTVTVDNLYWVSSSPLSSV